MKESDMGAGEDYRRGIEREGAEKEDDRVAEEPMAVMMSAPNAEGGVHGCPVGNMS
jgi:hypothetical protein